MARLAVAVLPNTPDPRPDGCMCVFHRVPTTDPWEAAWEVQVTTACPLHFPHCTPDVRAHIIVAECAAQLTDT